MNPSTLKTDRQHTAHLFAIYGGHDHAELPRLIQMAWIFASTCLWNDTQFSSREKMASQEKIADWLRPTKQVRRAFLSFCERILLSRMSALPAGDRTELPSQWLARDNKGGFAASKRPYRRIRSLRKSLPQYLYDWKALAEAVRDFGEDPTSDNFQYWKSYFIEKQSPELLQLFQVYVSNLHFSI